MLQTANKIRHKLIILPIQDNKVPIQDNKDTLSTVIQDSIDTLDHMAMAIQTNLVDIHTLI